MRKRSLDHGDSAKHVGVEDRVEEGGVARFERPVPRYAGAIHQHIDERYADSAAYVAAVRAAAAQMVAERLLLPQDAERAVELATQDRLSQLH
jgi:hypothetical protein